MPHANHYSQDSKYGQLAHKLLEIASISGRKVVVRRNEQTTASSIELLHEMGTTDVAIGDATAEVMITTVGKVPKEMYNLEDTSINSNLATHKLQVPSAFEKVIATTAKTCETSNESSNHSTILIALLIALLIILLLCCITACFVAKSKRKDTFFSSSDAECEPGCSGMNQPLLDKISQSTNKTSCCSLRN